LAEITLHSLIAIAAFVTGFQIVHAAHGDAG
jgi:hypothetical protein